METLKSVGIRDSLLFLRSPKVQERAFVALLSKNKAELTAGTDVDMILEKISEKYKKQPQNTIDGVKIEFDGDWVHLRKSNTEPIIRIYSESSSEAAATDLAERIILEIKALI